MKIRVSTLPQKGIDINDYLALTDINSRIQEGDSGGIIFTDPPKVDLHIKPTLFGAEVKGEISGSFKQPCALCSDDLSQALKVSIDWILKAKQGESADDDFDDVGLLSYSDDEIDLETHLQEAIILSQSPILKPPIEKDRCLTCGRACPAVLWSDPETTGTTNLGELLLAAQKKRKG